MTIRGKILLTVCIPVVGLAVFLAFNTFNMKNIVGQVEQTVNGVFIPIVENDIPQINESNSSIELLLNADRDAYQAYVAQIEAMETYNLDKLKQLDIDNNDNIQQVNDRVAQASGDFDQSMNQIYGTFKENFSVWKDNSRESLKMSLMLFENHNKRNELMASSVSDFDKMRDCIDRIQMLLESEIVKVVDDEESDSKKLNSLYESYSLLLNADRDAYQAYLAQMQALACIDPEEMAGIESDITENIQQVWDRAEKASITFNDDMNTIYNEFKELYQSWKVGSSTVVNLSSSSIDNRLTRISHHEKALAAFGVFRSNIDSLTGKLETRINDQVQNINTVSKQASVQSGQMCDNLNKNIATSGIIGAIIALISIVVSLYVCKVIIKSLRQAISSMTFSSEQVASAASQVSSTSQSLAEGSCQQAAGIEEVNSSMDEIANQTARNAENSKMAYKFAQEVNSSTQKCNQAMEEMSSAINDIQKSSEETSKIVKTIDEIAFQTNLLALNAAVEAARAGEAGKGFAVVAEEVRNLAMRSAEAARSTTGMIEESVKNANNGVEIVSKVGSVLTEIAGSVGQTTDYVSNITNSNDEQAAAIAQIKDAIAQMDTVTQASATAAEEGASAAEELTAQAETMNDIVRDLASMVGGDASPCGPSAIVKKSANKLSMSDKAFHEIAAVQNKAKYTTKPQSQSQLQASNAKQKAENAIPFEDDGFDEFN